MFISIGVATVWRIQRVFGLIIIIGVITVAMMSPREAPEDLRTVVKQYLVERDAATPTYVYYGAVPGFRYQLNLETREEEDIPAIWYRDCWAGEPKSYCSEDNIFYGQWIRQLSPEEKYNNILSTIDSSSNMEFWIIFSHTTIIERNELLDVLKETHINIEAFETIGASAYLFQKQ